MYFTNGNHQAFKSLMWDKPGDHYVSGADCPSQSAGVAAATVLIERIMAQSHIESSNSSCVLEHRF